MEPVANIIWLVLHNLELPRRHPSKGWDRFDCPYPHLAGEETEAQQGGVTRAGLLCCWLRLLLLGTSPLTAEVVILACTGSFDPLHNPDRIVHCFLFLRRS